MIWKIVVKEAQCRRYMWVFEEICENNLLWRLKKLVSLLLLIVWFVFIKFALILEIARIDIHIQNIEFCKFLPEEAFFENMAIKRTTWSMYGAA